MASLSLILAAVVCIAPLGAQTPMTMPAHPHMTPAIEKVEAPESCPHCGMNRTVFAHSRMLVTYEDGAVVGTCSLHCVATELGMSKGKPVKAVLVADYANKRKLVDAKTAAWVLGGNQKGVMTKEPKWAFEVKQDAERFIQMNGGKLATYAEVLELASHEPMH
jgi:copper chaperone NosL